MDFEKQKKYINEKLTPQEQLQLIFYSYSGVRELPDGFRVHDTIINEEKGIYAVLLVNEEKKITAVSSRGTDFAFNNLEIFKDVKYTWSTMGGTIYDVINDPKYRRFEEEYPSSVYHDAGAGDSGGGMMTLKNPGRVPIVSNTTRSDYSSWTDVPYQLLFGRNSANLSTQEIPGIAHLADGESLSDVAKTPNVTDVYLYPNKHGDNIRVMDEWKKVVLPFPPLSLPIQGAISLYQEVERVKAHTDDGAMIDAAGQGHWESSATGLDHQMYVTKYTQYKSQISTPTETANYIITGTGNYYKQVSHLITLSINGNNGLSTTPDSESSFSESVPADQQQAYNTSQAVIDQIDSSKLPSYHSVQTEDGNYMYFNSQTGEYFTSEQVQVGAFNMLGDISEERANRISETIEAAKKIQEQTSYRGGGDYEVRDGKEQTVVYGGENNYSDLVRIVDKPKINWYRYGLGGSYLVEPDGTQHWYKSGFVPLWDLEEKYEIIPINTGYDSYEIQVRSQRR